MFICIYIYIYIYIYVFICANTRLCTTYYAYTYICVYIYLYVDMICIQYYTSICNIWLHICIIYIYIAGIWALQTDAFERAILSGPSRDPVLIACRTRTSVGMSRGCVLPPSPEAASYSSMVEIKESARTTRIQQEKQELLASEGPKARPGGLLGVLGGL